MLTRTALHRGWPWNILISSRCFFSLQSSFPGWGRYTLVITPAPISRLRGYLRKDVFQLGNRPENRRCSAPQTAIWRCEPLSALYVHWRDTSWFPSKHARSEGWNCAINLHFRTNSSVLNISSKKMTLGNGFFELRSYVPIMVLLL